MSGIYLELPILGNINISISNADVFAFALRQMANYVVGSDISTGDTGRTINCDVVCRNGLLLDKTEKLFSHSFQLGRVISFNNNSLKFKSEYSLNKNGLTISSIRHVKRFLFKKKPDMKKYSSCHSLFYEMILFPIFAMYCIVDGYYLLHGSLLELGKKHVLLLGLDGVGKSSVCEMLVSRGEARILADNFVLFNGKTAIPLNMAMRLDPDKETNLRVLYRDRALSEVLPDALVNNPVVPEKAYLLYIASELNIRKMPLNPTALTMYLNNAPEIGAANNFLTPFIIGNSNVDWELKNLHLISNPRGQLSDVARGIADAD